MATLMRNEMIIMYVYTNNDRKFFKSNQNIIIKDDFMYNKLSTEIFRHISTIKTFDMYIF